MAKIFKSSAQDFQRGTKDEYCSFFHNTRMQASLDCTIECQVSGQVIAAETDALFTDFNPDFIDSGFIEWNIV